LARKFDTETGEYEYLQPAPNGVDVLCDELDQPIVVKGKAKGKLELVPLDGAAQFGFRLPQRVKSPIQPMTVEQKIDGLDTYKRVYTQVWQWRGESRRCVDTRWADYLAQSDFLDCFVLKRRLVPVKGILT